MKPGRGYRLGGLAGGIVLMVAAVLLAIDSWPQSVRARSLSFGSDNSPVAQPGGAPILASAYTLHLEWPAFVRLGDAGLIRLTFDPVRAAALLPSRESGKPLAASPNPPPEPEMPMLVEARLEVSGLDVDPSGVSSMPLSTDGGLGFSWTVHPSLPGNYHAVVWLSLRSASPSSGPGPARALAAIPIDIQVFSILGIETGSMRILAVAGLLVGLILTVASRKRTEHGRGGPAERVAFRHDENNMK